MSRKTWILLPVFLLGACNQVSCGYQPVAPISDSAWDLAWTLQVSDIWGSFSTFEACAFEDEDYRCISIP